MAKSNVPKKNSINISKYNINSSKSQDIVIKDPYIKLSNTNLKLNLSKTYEKARKDARKFKFCNLYSVFFSIAGALIVALLTADFKSILGIPADIVTVLAWIIFSVAIILGIICLILYATKRENTLQEERDKTVSQIISEIENND